MLNIVNRAVFAAIPFVLIVFYGAVHVADAGDPTNPLKGNLTIHDPSSIQNDNGIYYTFGSHGTGLSSKDRITWNPVTSPVKSMGTKSWWKEHGGDIWAPECVRMDGSYYFFYSISAWMEFNSAIGVATGTTTRAG